MRDVDQIDIMLTRMYQCLKLCQKMELLDLISFQIVCERKQHEDWNPNV